MTRFVTIVALLFAFSGASANPMPQVTTTESRTDGPVPGLEQIRSTPGTANHPRLAARLQMESRFRVLDARFDSLWADSLLVPMPERRQFLNALQTALRVRDSAKARLSELRILEGESNPAKWESIRKKTQRSLDGLHRFFLDAESVLQADLKSKESIAPVHDGEVF